nr:probable sucrose-phosphate synthase 1 [Tanacetum cinerariifolium]
MCNSCTLGCRGRPLVDENSGWSSPNRDHFYSERFSRISNGFKRQGAVSRLSKSERKTAENLDFGETSERVSNIYFEAKKHLSKMLNNDTEHTELTVEDNSTSLGKLLDFPCYSLFLRVSVLDMSRWKTLVKWASSVIDKKAENKKEHVTKDEEVSTNYCYAFNIHKHGLVAPVKKLQKLMRIQAN